VHEALILAQRIIEVAQQNLFEELEPIRRLSSANAPRLYPKYLESMDEAASRLSLPPDKIEFFLFEFGLHLKPGHDRGRGGQADLGRGRRTTVLKITQ
jgi:hypothetical protein